MRLTPITLAAGLLALTAVTAYSSYEAHGHQPTDHPSEQLANNSGSNRGTAHRGSGRRAVLAYEFDLSEYLG